MDKYIVISNIGCYAEEISQRFANYRGIDRFPWPLDKNDLKKLDFLSDEAKKEAEGYLKNIKTLNIKEMYCSDFEYAYRYAKLCDLLDIKADLFLCRAETSEFDDIDKDKYAFMGYDYVLKSAAYSCIIYEKHLIDRIEKIVLNENGLFNDYLAVQKFAELREKAKKEHNSDGFEAGDSGIDFYAVALFLYKE